jgi:4'-phosphopantetheinyl transferase
VTEGPWIAPPHELKLTARDVHLWRASLRREDREIAELSEVLSREELLRRDRFVFDRERDRYTAARALLRIILARYLATTPRDTEIVEALYGKPRVPAATVEFNLSHSGELVLVAVAQGRRVGVDIECERPVADAASIAERCFSSSERLLIAQAEAAARPRAFLECWTSKEAQAKAFGSGLRTSLPEIDVWRPTPRRHYQIPEAQAMGSWTLQQVEAGEGFVACVVVEGDDDWALSKFEEVCKSLAGS